MGEKLKIALIIERMDPRGGGRERSVGEIASALAGRGHQVTVICRQGRPPGAGVEVVRPGSGRALRRRPRAFAAAVRRVLQQGHFDVSHAVTPVPGVDIYQPRGGTVPGMLAAGDRRRGPFGRLLARALRPANRARHAAAILEQRLAAEQSTWWVAISELVAEEFAVYFGRRENVRVVYSGVSVPRVDERTRPAWRAEMRRRWGLGPESTVFLTVAHNFALKGVPEAVAAFGEYLRSAGREDDRLIVVGADRRAGRCRRAAGRTPAAGKVIFTGGVEDVFPLYSAADAVVLLSWQDACSRVVLEALRWGVPSVTTRYNGAAELLVGGAGVVVESPRDVGGVVAALAELADPARRRAMSEACLARADRAGMARQVGELEALYREVAQR